MKNLLLSLHFQNLKINPTWDHQTWDHQTWDNQTWDHPTWVTNVGPPNMGPPNMGQPKWVNNMGQPNMGPPNMGPIPETYMNQPNKKQNVGIENPGMKGNPGKPGIEKFNIAGPINPQVNRQVVQQNVSKSEKT